MLLDPLIIIGLNITTSKQLCLSPAVLGKDRTLSPPYGLVDIKSENTKFSSNS
jgi:hypothetical protein